MGALDQGAVLQYTLATGTPTLLTYYVPNDGNYHAVIITGSVIVTSAETGGAIQVVLTDATSGQTSTTTVSAGTLAAGVQNTTLVTSILSAGSTIKINQSSSLTAGAATANFKVFVSDAAITG
jgi:hypothetical protein